MHTITFEQKERMGRSPHDLGAVWKLEATVPVPVHAHPKSEHFRVLGAGQIKAPLSNTEIATINQAAQRVAVTEDPTGFQVVVDGKYIAGAFKMSHDYSGNEAGELRAAECAVRTSMQLASGHQPTDLGMKLVNT